MGGGVTSPYVWIEYKVNTNTWNTTEWGIEDIPIPMSSEHFQSQKDDVCGVTTSPTYTINQSTGEFSLTGSHNTYVDSQDKVSQIGEWSQYHSDNPGASIETDKLLYVDRLVCGGTGNYHNSSGRYTKDNADVYYTRAIRSVKRTIPHISTSIDWNTIVRVHLTEQTGQQFKKYPLVE